MPYIKFTKKVKGKKKWCIKNKETGKVYCSDSKEKREKMIRMHEAFKHGWKPTRIRRYNK